MNRAPVRSLRFPSRERLGYRKKATAGPLRLAIVSVVRCSAIRRLMVAIREGRQNPKSG